MRATSLAVQSIVLLGIAGLVSVALRSRVEPLGPEPPASAPWLAGSADSAAGTTTSTNRNAVLAPVVATRLVQIVDRETGDPVAGVPLLRIGTTPSRSSRPFATTDAEGLAELPVDRPPGSRLPALYTARLPGFATSPIVLTPAARPTARAEVYHLSRAGRLTGRVYFPNSGWLDPERVSIRVLVPFDDPEASRTGAAPSTSAASRVAVRGRVHDGRSIVLTANIQPDMTFEIVGIPPELDGLAVDLDTTSIYFFGERASLKSFRPGESRVLDLYLRSTIDMQPTESWLASEPTSRGLRLEDVPADVLGDQSVNGTLYLSDGTPAAFVHVIALTVEGVTAERWVCDRGVELSAPRALTDATGWFKITGLGPGPVYIGRRHRRAGQLHWLFRVLPGSASVRLEEPAPLWVEGRYVDSGAGPIWLVATTRSARKVAYLSGGDRIGLGPFGPEELDGPVTLEAKSTRSLAQNVQLSRTVVSPGEKDVDLTAY